MDERKLDIDSECGSRPPHHLVIQLVVKTGDIILSTINIEQKLGFFFSLKCNFSSQHLDLVYQCSHVGNSTRQAANSEARYIGTPPRPAFTAMTVPAQDRSTSPTSFHLATLHNTFPSARANQKPP